MTMGDPRQEYETRVSAIARLLEANDIEAARRETVRLLKRAEGRLDPIPFSQLIGAIGTQFLLHSQPASAVDLFARSLELKESAGVEGESLAVTLHNLAGAHQLLGHHAQAATLYQRELDLGASLDSLQDRYATVRALVEVLRSDGRIVDAKAALRAAGVEAQRLAHGLASQAPPLALELARESVALLSEISDDNPDLAAPLCLLARLQRGRGELAQASRLYERALVVAGDDSLARSAALNGLGMLALARGDRDRGVSLLEEALSLAGATPSDQVLSALVNLGQAHPDAQKRQTALRRALDLTSRIPGGETVLPIVLEKLAWNYVLETRISDAIPLVERLAALRAAGPDYRARAAALRMQGIVYRMARRLVDARRCLEEAVECAHRLGDANLHTSALSDLALLYVRSGELTLAETALKAAQRLADQHQLGKQERAVLLNQLATLREETHDLPAAYELYAKAQALLDDAPNDDETAINRLTILNNRALLLRKMDRWQESAEAFEQVIAAHRARGSERTVACADAMRNLGSLYEEIGTRMTSSAQPAEILYERSEALMTDAKAIFEEIGDTKTSNYGRVLFSLGFLACARGEYGTAEDYYRKAVALAEELGTTTLPFETKSIQDLNMVYGATGRFEQAFEHLYTCMHSSTRSFEHAFAVSTDAARLAFADRWRGELYALLTLVRTHLRASPSVRAKALNMVLARKSIVTDAALTARLFAHPRDPKVADLVERTRRLEQQLARAVVESTADSASLQQQQQLLLGELATLTQLPLDLTLLDAAQIAEVLPPGTALVEVVWHAEFEYAAIPARGEHRWGPPHYLAFVLRAGEPVPDVIDLGLAERIDALVKAWRDHVESGLQHRDLTGEAHAPSSDEDLREAAIALADAVIEPIRTALGGLRDIVIAPDGQLGLVPFEAVQLRDGRFAIDDLSIRYVSTGRDLLRHGHSPAASLGAAVVATDPDYGPAGVYSLAALPGTRAEGTAIGSLLGIEALTGGEVTKTALTALRSPKLLHLATHGVFIENAARNERDSLYRSGLALAGANSGDGILWAADAVELDLAGTELVVLSACNTGVGGIHVGEGVFGLRRAFAIAGAQSLVMSMWRVPDDQTHELMVELYRRLRAGEGRARALRNAQITIRARWPHPAFWGAFICQGDAGSIAWPTLQRANNVAARDRS